MRWRRDSCREGSVPATPVDLAGDVHGHGEQAEEHGGAKDKGVVFGDKETVDARVEQRQQGGEGEAVAGLCAGWDEWTRYG